MRYMIPPALSVHLSHRRSSVTSKSGAWLGAPRGNPCAELTALMALLILLCSLSFYCTASEEAHSCTPEPAETWSLQEPPPLHTPFDKKAKAGHA